jgi:glyoxylase-like metal-dependent hydrolase (beta-lactamase superfamily II)
MTSDKKIRSKAFVFSPFQENTYVLYNSQNKAIVIDPGMQNVHEEKIFSDFLTEKGLTLEKVLLTHAHIDHIFGLNYVVEKYNVPVVMHKDSIAVLNSVPDYASVYGFDFVVGDYDIEVIDENDKTAFDLNVLHIPGHVPGHLVFYHPEQAEAWVGDVLFYQSIGRTDLPGGDHQLLISGIKDKLFKLPENVRIYSGHGPTTNLGFEKENNPFLA